MLESVDYAKHMDVFSTVEEEYCNDRKVLIFSTPINLDRQKSSIVLPRFCNLTVVARKEHGTPLVQILTGEKETLGVFINRLQHEHTTLFNEARCLKIILPLTDQEHATITQSNETEEM